MPSLFCTSNFFKPPRSNLPMTEERLRQYRLDSYKQTAEKVFDDIVNDYSKNGIDDVFSNVINDLKQKKSTNSDCYYIVAPMIIDKRSRAKDGGGVVADKLWNYLFDYVPLVSAPVEKPVNLLSDADSSK